MLLRALHLSCVIAEGSARPHTWLNVVPDDADVFVPVGPRVFVPESDHMTQLVHHDAELVAVFPDGNGLGASATTAHIGAAPMNHTHSDC